MINLSRTDISGWNAALRGMRNPLNSWGRSDSSYFSDGSLQALGRNDQDLAQRLIQSGTDHRKFMRMITVTTDIYAPLYWWKEFDTYKVGTVANSCSTMHTVHMNPFTMDDFSHEHLISLALLDATVKQLNRYRDVYINYDKQDSAYTATFSKKDIWWQLIQLLPSSYNQLRTVMMNYEVLANIYKSRKNHKLDEWREFCDWVCDLPYSELIVLDSKSDGFDSARSRHQDREDI